MTDIKIPYLECNRCGHKWIPRTNKYPKVCSKCNSPYWNKDRKLEVKKDMKKKISKEEADEIGEMTEMAYYAPKKRKN